MATNLVVLDVAILCFVRRVVSGGPLSTTSARNILVLVIELYLKEPTTFPFLSLHPLGTLT